MRTVNPEAPDDARVHASSPTCSFRRDRRLVARCFSISHAARSAGRGDEKHGGVVVDFGHASCVSGSR